MIKKRFSHNTCCKLQDLGGQENLRKMDAKMDPKSDQNGTTNHPDARFLRFWSVLGGGFFSTFVETGKSWPKIQKNPEKSQRGALGLLARRNARGQRRGKERFRTSPGLARILIRNLKPKFQDLEFQELTKTSRNLNCESSTPCPGWGGGKRERAFRRALGKVYRWVLSFRRFLVRRSTTSTKIEARGGQEVPDNQRTKMNKITQT